MTTAELAPELVWTPQETLEQATDAFSERMEQCPLFVQVAQEYAARKYGKDIDNTGARYAPYVMTSAGCTFLGVEIDAPGHPRRREPLRIRFATVNGEEPYGEKTLATVVCEITGDRTREGIIRDTSMVLQTWNEAYDIMCKTLGDDEGVMKESFCRDGDTGRIRVRQEHEQ